MLVDILIAAILSASIGAEPAPVKPVAIPVNQDTNNGEPAEIQEVIDESRARCRGLRGSFSMPREAVRTDLDLNMDGRNDFLIDNNMFVCDRGNARSYRPNQNFGPDNKVTAIISERGGYTTHEFLAFDYKVIDFDEETLIILREPEGNCNSPKILRPLNRDGSRLVGPGCYRALVWRDGVFISAN